MTMQIGCIVPTKDRPVDIKNLLNSLASQKRKPEVIIIVDGSDNPVKEVVDQFSQQLNIIYKTLRPPGLARQKNKGISLIPKEIDWVGFLDDDLVLEEDCISNLFDYLCSDKEVKGVGLSINNQPIVKHESLKKLLLLDKKPGGNFTLSGFPSAIRPTGQNLQVEWVYGGATFWKKEVLSQYKFDEWFSGVGYLEDVDYSYRVSRKNKIVIRNECRCWHYHHEINTERLPLLGQWHFVAWWYFVSKTNNFNKFLTIYSMLSLALFNLAIGLILRNKRSYNTSLGNFKGLKTILYGNTQDFKGFQKK
ncbi:glycosyltransferase family 2 protein [Halobacteriovorax sp. HLS]|uniref:glycosyltransferase family 2 protein n=1 Tax=Halobacteriovorax sp. HLS TaxID=2234000 RepID=UPI000FDA2EAE|nr:glycosyltransferase [Halobacteriovorax sp. HLS]